MNKKIVLPISLVLLVGLVGFVLAYNATKEIPGYGSISGNYVETPIKVFPGWNMFHFFPNPDWINSGLPSKNVKAIYWYDSLNKEYLRFYPNPDPKIAETKMKFHGSSFWVYIVGIDNNGVDMTYMTLEPPKVEGRYLLKGWNFISITSDMIADGPTPRAKDLAGTCNIEKSYFWDSTKQEWGQYPLTEQFETNALGYGWVVKVSEDCKLGIAQLEIPTVPEIPN